VTYTKDQKIFGFGDDSNKIYLIKTGSVKFTIPTKKPSLFRRIEMSTVGAGEMFGVEDVMREQPRSYDCF
jgi:CRP-like cAMP-binding protein